VHSTAECCAPVWCRSTHTCLIDHTIKDTLRIETGCLLPRSVDNLPILAGIQPAELHCNGVTLSLAHCALELGHLLHSMLTHPSTANAQHLKPRHPFVPAAQQLIRLFNSSNIRAAHWEEHQWNAEWANNPTKFRIFISDTATHPLGLTLPRTALSGLNAPISMLDLSTCGSPFLKEENRYTFRTIPREYWLVEVSKARPS